MLRIIIFVTTILISMIANGQSFLTRSIYINDIVYHSTLDRIFAATPSNQTDGNAILVIHPRTGVTEQRIPTAAEPMTIQLSSDQQFLYIAYHGYNEVQRLHTTTYQIETIADFVFTYQGTSGMGNEGFRLGYPYNFLLVPNEDNSFLISNRNNQLVVYDGDAPRSTTASFFSGLTGSLTYHERTNLVYGSKPTDRGSGELFQYEVTASGIDLRETIDGVRNEDGLLKIYDDLLLATQTGDVIDLSTDDPINRGNTFRTNSGAVFFRGMQDYDPVTDQLVAVGYNTAFAPGSDNWMRFKTFSIDDLSNTSEIEVIGFTERPRKMIHTGAANSFAMITNNTPSISFPAQATLLLINNCDPLDTEISITPNTTRYCFGDTIQLTASPSNAAQYIWSNGLTGNPIRFVAEENIDIRVEAFYDTGCEIGESEVLALEVFDLANTIAISGEPRKCYNDSTELRAFAADAVTYLWNTGATSDRIFAHVPGVYTVEGFNENGCSLGNPVSFTVEDFPGGIVPKPTILHPDTVYSCDRFVNLAVQPEPYFIQWLEENRFSEFSNLLPSQGHVLTVDEPEAYFAQFENEYGCKGEHSDTVKVLFYDRPPTPRVRNQADTLLRILPYLPSYAALYDIEWYLNNELIPNITADSLLPMGTGFYYAKFVDINDCYSLDSDLTSLVDSTMIAEPTRILGSVNLVTGFDGDDLLTLPYRNQPLYIPELDNLFYTNDGGQFDIGIFASDVTDGIYNLELRSDTTLWTVFNGTRTATANTITHPDSSYHFNLLPKIIQSDVALNIQTGITRCFAETPIWVNIDNQGTTVFSGDVCLELDPRLDNLMVEGTSMTPLPPQVCWTFESFAPGQQAAYQLQANMPGVEALGDSVRFNLVAKEMEMVVTEQYYAGELRCAYDPNDKLVQPARGEDGNYALFSDDLQYTIRFQNTGNDTAFTVRLEDYLSTDLRWETFTPKSASHDYRTQLDLKTGLLEVIFEDILLPDSTTNLAGSQGYFSFEISPQLGLEENTLITNKAGIFFDFNPPIITNLTSSEMVSMLPVNNSTANISSAINNLSIVPNPHHSQTYIIFEPLPITTTLSVFTPLGKLVEEYVIPSRATQQVISTINWQKGSYFYQRRGTQQQLIGSGYGVKH